MEKILIYLLLFSSLSCVAQTSIKTTVLDNYQLISECNTMHTAKIEVFNNSDAYQFVYLTNEENVTGYSSKGCDWRHPISFLSEYGSTMTLDLKHYTPIVFGTWYKRLKPHSTFTFYFQFSCDLSILSSLKKRIHVMKDNNNTKTSEELSWKEDMIIIPLKSKD